ncbi:MAG TPA: OmpA family protein [Bacteroidales bacterium]|nr:OmpA family protein [Bacteroidales bacterium]
MLIWALLLTVGPVLQAQEGGDEPPCPPPDNKKVEKIYEAAVDAYRAGRTGEASGLLREVVDKEPEYADAWYVLGLIYIKHRNPNLIQAGEYFGKVVALCPEYDPYVYYYLGQIAYTEERYADAVPLLEKFLEDVDKVRSDKDYDEALNYLRFSKVTAELMNRRVPFDPKPVVGISTERDEYLPIITPDQRYAYFTRRVLLPPNINDLIPKAKEREYFMFSQRSGDHFDAGLPMPQPFNQRQNEGGATLTADNRELFYTLCENTASGYYNCDICTSRKDWDQWSAITNAGKGVNTADHWESQPSVTSDGKILFFISDRPGGLGGYDIYYSERQADGSWGKAENMGEPINTPGNEKSPFIHTDSQTLYFSSEGHPGLGGYDIFFARKEDGKWKRPVNIGFPINSKEDDVGFFVSTDGRYGYFASNKLNGQGGWDLYSFELYDEARPQKVLLLKGTVKDERNDTLVQARVELRNAETRKITEIPVNRNTGEYVAVVPLRNDYILTVKKEGFAYSSHYIEADDTTAGKAQEVDMAIKPIEVGESYKLNDIHFATDSFSLTPASGLVIEGFVEFLRENPRVKVTIEGHTDDVGDAAYNQRLSEQRARSVFDQLLRQGIPADRLNFAGFGESRPVASNATEEGRAKNRRTVFVVVNID